MSKPYGMIFIVVYQIIWCTHWGQEEPELVYTLSCCKPVIHFHAPNWCITDQHQCYQEEPGPPTEKCNFKINTPILPGAFLTFASKSSVGPSYAANWQEDHKTYTNLRRILGKSFWSSCVRPDFLSKHHIYQLQKFCNNCNYIFPFCISGRGCVCVSVR